MDTQVKRQILSYILCLFYRTEDVKTFIDQLSEDRVDYLHDLTGEEIVMVYIKQRLRVL